MKEYARHIVVYPVRVDDDCTQRIIHIAFAGGESEGAKRERESTEPVDGSDRYVGETSMGGEVTRRAACPGIACVFVSRKAGRKALVASGLTWARVRGGVDASVDTDTDTIRATVGASVHRVEEEPRVRVRLRLCAGGVEEGGQRRAAPVVRFECEGLTHPTAAADEMGAHSVPALSGQDRYHADSFPSPRLRAPETPAVGVVAQRTAAEGETATARVENDCKWTLSTAGKASSASARIVAFSEAGGHPGFVDIGGTRRQAEVPWCRSARWNKIPHLGPHKAGGEGPSTRTPTLLQVETAKQVITEGGEDSEMRQGRMRNGRDEELWQTPRQISKLRFLTRPNFE
ncbi:hypothetical protein C8R44DRAFT_858488 [Mycena epipterygia]|nr:hypothetical protein C8R44DRAFT_858488 [Mycena epipterygia]